MAFPALPERLRIYFDQHTPGFWSWWQGFNNFMKIRFETDNDVRILNPARGLILTNAAGTVTKRIRLNDAGDGIFIEDL